jgi:hypothetical protein
MPSVLFSLRACGLAPDRLGVRMCIGSNPPSAGCSIGFITCLDLAIAISLGGNAAENAGKNIIHSMAEFDGLSGD